MSDNSASLNGGISFAGLMTILFIGLKLTGYIARSCWWVLSPIWIPLLVVGICLALAALLTFIAGKLK